MQTNTIFDETKTKNNSMKKITLVLSVFIITMFGLNVINPTQSFAAFPISSTQQAQIEKENALMQETIAAEKNKQQLVSTQTTKATKTTAEDNGLYGMLALGMGVVGWILFWGGFGLSGLGGLLLLGAFITGIIGVKSTRKYKGMALTGLILGAVGVLIFLLAVTVLTTLIV
jgi:hypothetical protein